MAFSYNLWQLGLLRVGVGFFAGSILTLAYGLGGTVVPNEQRSSAFGALNSGAMVGSSLRGAFLFNAGIFFIGLLAVWRGLGVRREPT
jgi:MFS family permease